VAARTNNYGRARRNLIRATSAARVYGVPLDDSDDHDEYVVFSLQGWSTGTRDRRDPSDRIFRVRRDQVHDSGTVDGYEVEGRQVHWYEIDLGSYLIEELHLGMPVAAVVSGRFGFGGVGDVPVTIDPGGSRPPGEPPLTIDPGGSRPPGSPPGTITP
jgi:hypothetical protein